MRVAWVRLMNERKRDAARRARGVTLVEVLIVVAIMALISGAVALGVMQHFKKAKETTARTDAIAVREAVKAWWFMNESESCPTMTELVSSGVLDAISPKKDPWGSPWHIDCAGSAVTVSSDGADRTEGTADDIKVPPKTAS
jgi:general secretion pathway protein G